MNDGNEVQLSYFGETEKRIETQQDRLQSKKKCQKQDNSQKKALFPHKFFEIQKN